nr:reverse transcriptase domain-containing protein [Tanacetum cinerariifolium]
MITPTPSTGRESTTDIAIATETAPAIRRGEGIVNPHYPAYRKATPVMEAYFMQQKKYVKDPVEIHNIKQKDGETIEDFMEMFKVETGRMKGAPECSSTEVIYEHCFNRLQPEVKNQMVPTTTSLTGFIGKKLYGRWDNSGSWLLVTIGDADHSTRAWMNFMIVRSLSPYNGIIRRPGIKEIQAVPSTAYEMLKFPADGGIVTIRSTILIPAECATEVAIEGTLSAKGRTELCSLLKENLDIFAWQPSDMTGVPRSVVEHRLNIREGYPPVWQKKRGQAPKCAKAIQAEVQKIAEAEIMREDCYPLSEIDWKVESLCGYHFKCFLDAYKCYHQIQLAESDEEKTAFHTGQGVYCYTKMPFGLKNAGATYQRLLDKAFDNQIGRNIEVYVEDLVIKSHTEAEMLRDIGETFRMLRKINMKLNPKKCTFGAVEGMFLGYMITLERIKPCPDKTKVVLQLLSSRTIKERDGSDASLLRKPRITGPGTELYSNGKASSITSFRSQEALERDGSDASLLRKPRITGPGTELYSNGKASSITSFRSQEALENITYRPRTSVKGQVLADFLAEMQDESPLDASVVETQQDPWTLFTDGSSSVNGSGAGLILTSPEETKFTYALRFHFAAFNNEAEYEALIAGLRLIAQMGVQNVHVSIDPKLLANQVLGAYVAKEENTIKYLEKVKSLVSGFTNFSINQVPRSKNKKADALSKIASNSFAHLSKQVLVEILKEKSIQEKEVTTVVEEDGPTWMTPIIEYLNEGTFPSDRKEARKLCIKAR